MNRRSRVVSLAFVLLIGGLLMAAVWRLNFLDEAPLDEAMANAAPPPAELVARGAYLARAGNCQGCHSALGGAAYAGGRGVPTPFGTVYAPNLTPDVDTGIGAWSAGAFWRAMHNGRSRDGRLLYPTFPYPNYTRITREDSDALHAFLRSLPAVSQANQPHELRFPFDQQAALAVWRALYFRPAPPENNASRSAEWNRGAYLVEGLGHCNACHASRNALGASVSTLDLAGGLIPVQNWYAPSLTSPAEAGVAAWETQHVVDLLKTGTASPQGRLASVAGPMLEVVLGSTQHLSDADLRAMANYLKALPPSATDERLANLSAAAGDLTPSPADGPGATLYARHCAACHGEQGEGVAGIYPALAGNRAVTLTTPANLVHVVLEGGFAPATAGNPRPFGMPPFATELSDEQLAQLLTHIRGGWGNRAAPVSALEAGRYRSSR